MLEDTLKQCAELIRQADALLIAAGAGMGVDSGLPDFRGTEGFWNAYPGLRAHGLQFTDMAHPRTFEDHPRLAWGFYGHRLQLYRNTQPHAGFQMLPDWSKAKPGGGFVLTSNVHSPFSRAGFAKTQVASATIRVQSFIRISPLDLRTRNIALQLRHSFVIQGKCKPIISYYQIYRNLYLKLLN